MRDYKEISKMAEQDYSIGLTAHYQPLSELITRRGYKSVIEIGTAYGGNAFYMLQNTKIDRLTCIDPYIYYPAMPGFICQEEYDTLYQFAKDRLNDDRAYIIRGNSEQALTYLTPADLIFLDGSHDYKDVKWECDNYSKLVKKGGVLSGHDYDIFEGVNKAVDEFAIEVDRKVNFLPGNIWYINY